MLRRLYSEPAAPSAFSILHKLQQAVRHVATRKRKTLGQIRACLDSRCLYNAPIRQKRLPQKSIHFNNIDDDWEIDIIDLSSVKKYNDNHRYLL